MLDEVRRVSRLVEAILVSTRADQVLASSLDLSSVLLDEAERWQSRVRERNIAFRMEIESLSCAILREEAGCVLDNLLANAAKHAPSGSTIHVTAKRHDGRARLVVRDEGPGVPPAIRESVFEPFFRDDGAPIGVGIGLALARRIVTTRGGTIRLEEASPGARLVVELPLVRVAEATRDPHR